MSPISHPQPLAPEAEVKENDRSPIRPPCVSGRSGCGSAQGDVGIDHHLDQLLEADLAASSRAPASPCRVAQQQIDLGRAIELRVDRRRAAASPGPAWSKAISTNSSTRVRLAGADDVVVRLRPAGASATWPGRSRRRSPSRAWRPGCPAAAPSARPSLIRATPCVILRVTNSRPRRGDSWLNRMPEQANRP